MIENPNREAAAVCGGAGKASGDTARLFGRNSVPNAAAAGHFRPTSFGVKSNHGASVAFSLRRYPCCKSGAAHGRVAILIESSENLETRLNHESACTSKIHLKASGLPRPVLSSPDVKKHKIMTGLCFVIAT